MEISGLKKQQHYLMEKVRKLSDEIVNIMELLELVSQMIEQDEEQEKKQEYNQMEESDSDSDSDNDSDVKMGLNDLIEINSDEN